MHYVVVKFAHICTCYVFPFMRFAGPLRTPPLETNSLNINLQCQQTKSKTLSFFKYYQRCIYIVYIDK